MQWNNNNKRQQNRAPVPHLVEKTSNRERLLFRNGGCPRLQIHGSRPNITPRPPGALAEPSETVSGGDPPHPHPPTGVPRPPSRVPGAAAHRLPAAWPRGHPSNPRATAHLLGSPLKTPPPGHRCPEDGGKKSRWPVQSRALPHPTPPGNCSLEPLLMRDICYPQAVGSGKTSPANLLLNLRGGSHLLIKSRRSFFSRMDKNVNNNARPPSLQKLPSRRLPREFSLCLSFPV